MVTEENINAEDEPWVTDHLQKMMKIMEAIRANPAERGVEKRIDCPVCRGSQTLSYGRNTYNGHLHAHCRGCNISIMQ